MSEICREVVFCKFMGWDFGDDNTSVNAAVSKTEALVAMVLSFSDIYPTIQYNWSSQWWKWKEVNL